MGASKVAVKLPRISRPAGLTHADRPVEIPVPEHPHLPNWVRRIHNQASPVFGDLLGQLDAGDREALQEKLSTVVGQISAGKFSHAWQYQTLIENGYASWIRDRESRLEAERSQRRVEGLRARLMTEIKDPKSALSSETTSRLTRALSSAPDDDALLEVEQEVKRALEAAQSNATRRRDREIAKTRERISKTSPRSSASAPRSDENWQDVLRRWQEAGTSD